MSYAASCFIFLRHNGTEYITILGYVWQDLAYFRQNFMVSCHIELIDGKIFVKLESNFETQLCFLMRLGFKVPLVSSLYTITMMPSSCQNGSLVLT